MADLTLNMAGQEFISKLNDAIEAASLSGPGAGSGTASTIFRTVSMQMQMGKMDTTGANEGYIARNTATNSDDNFNNYCHTILMLGIENCTVSSITTQTGESLTIFCYGYDSTNGGPLIYKTSVTDPSNIPANTCYIKIMLENENGFDVMRQLEVKVAGKPTFIKNITPASNVPQYFSFETSYPSKAETSESTVDSYMGAGGGVSIKCYDNGFIVLPPNYHEQDAPVPLVVYCHDKDEFGWASNVNSKNARIFSFLANNGYAVCDCSHLTNNYTSFNDSICLPSITSTIASLIKFVQMNYNVETDGIYVTGKSAGGFACMLLPQIEGFKIKAAAGLATTIFPFMKFYNGGNMVKEDSINKAYREALWEQYNITEIEDKEETGISNIHSYNAYVNASKLRRHDPLLKSTNITTEELQTLIKYYYKSGKKYLTDFITAAENGNMGEEVKQKIVNIVNKIKITFNCPIKIWHSENDEAAGCVMSELFVEWCKRGGTPAYFRKLNPIVKPEDEDEPYITAHNLVDEINEDGKTNAIEMVYHTKYGGDMTETVAICEMVDWFNQW